MTGNFKFNRQKIDYLLTDLLPYEKGNHYTHRYFYEYLQKEKKILKKLFTKTKKEKKFFNPKWHSSPLKFKISKKKQSFREIALINPLGLVESLIFIHLFENDIINIIHNKNDFSARKAYRTNSLIYRKNKNQTVYYTDSTSKNQLLLSLESSGTYFNHFPFKNITKLLNSKRFVYSRDNFELLLLLDMQDCFQSIYTHSYKWLISNKTYDSKNLKDSNSVYSSIDAFLQNINGSKTNGIIVGPEISRLLAEFLFVHIDQQIIERLAMENINFGKDYNIYRFVDDYFISSKNEKIQNNIQDIISNILNKYHLKINDSKVSKKGKGESLNNWLIEVMPVIKLIEDIIIKKNSNIENSLEVTLSHLELPKEYVQMLLEVAASVSSPSGKKRDKIIKYSDLRSRVLSTINSSNESALICSYILSTILKKIEGNKDEDLLINMELNELVIFIFFIYSKEVNYSSTQKIIRIFSLLIDKHHIDIKDKIERNLERFEDDIFTKFSNDWIDLLLFFANYEINISYNLIEKITYIFGKEENPVNLAALCIFAESKFIKTKKIINNVNGIIKNNIEKINWGDLFQDEQGWWIYIFLSYPRLKTTIKRDIKRELNTVKSNLKSTHSDDAKKFVLDFLLNSDKHFIEWDFKQENYYKKYFFYTKDRTVFNPDVIDQISISR